MKNGDDSGILGWLSNGVSFVFAHTNLLLYPYSKPSLDKHHLQKIMDKLKMQQCSLKKSASIA